MDIPSSAQTDFALSILKQSAAATEALAKIIEVSADASKAILALGVGGNLDLNV